MRLKSKKNCTRRENNFYENFIFNNLSKKSKLTKYSGQKTKLNKIVCSRFKMFTVIHYLTLIAVCKGQWIGFDCGSTTPNITTYSLLDSGECDFKTPITNSSNVQIELLQMVEFRKTSTIQCKIKIDRKIFWCGMFGHLLPVETENMIIYMRLATKNVNYYTKQERLDMTTHT